MEHVYKVSTYFSLYSDQSFERIIVFFLVQCLLLILYHTEVQLHWTLRCVNGLPIRFSGSPIFHMICQNTIFLELNRFLPCVKTIFRAMYVLRIVVFTLCKFICCKFPFLFAQKYILRHFLNITPYSTICCIIEVMVYELCLEKMNKFTFSPQVAYVERSKYQFYPSLTW